MCLIFYAQGRFFSEVSSLRTGKPEPGQAPLSLRDPLVAARDRKLQKLQEDMKLESKKMAVQRPKDDAVTPTRRTFIYSKQSRVGMHPQLQDSFQESANASRAPVNAAMANAAVLGYRGELVESDSSIIKDEQASSRVKKEKKPKRMSKQPEVVPRIQVASAVYAEPSIVSLSVPVPVDPVQK
jgi:hypothetical protein